WGPETLQRRKEIKESHLFLGQIAVIGSSDYHAGTVTLAQYNGQNYFITADHLFWSYDENEISNLKIVVKIQGHSFVYSGEALGHDPDNDIAILDAPSSDCL